LLFQILSDSFLAVFPSGEALAVEDFSAAVYDSSLWSIESVTTSG
jgi:hypothetical protein